MLMLLTDITRHTATFLVVAVHTLSLCMQGHLSVEHLVSSGYFFFGFRSDLWPPLGPK